MTEYRKQGDQKMAEQIQAIAAKISEGAEGRMDQEQGCATLRLSETAAEKVLALCAANPLPENLRPSRAANKNQHAKRSRMLTRRVLRALNIGQAGPGPASQKFPVSIWFASNPALYYVAHQLGAEPNQASSLTELIA